MNIFSIIKQSIIALKANKLRSFFSILGIVIGVSAVVIILSLGQSLKGFVTNEIEAFGPGILDIAVKIPEASEVGSAISIIQGVKITTLKIKDIKALKDKERFPYIEAVTGETFAQEWAVYKDKEKKVLLFGANADFPLVMRTAKVDKGRFFTDTEDETLAKVAVLGSNLTEDFFGPIDPIGKKIKLKGQSFKVVGTLEPMGGFSFGGVDMNDFMYIPIETALKEVLGIDYLLEIILTIKDESYSVQAIEEISQLLRRHHNIKDPAKDDFQITTMEEVISQVQEMSVVLNLLLGFLAAISLLVGGIGIMNIMLVSVSERTHEIGLRKSLGATKKNILWQFLIESLIITILGGVIGIVLGIGNFLLGSLIVRTQGLSSWPMDISWVAIAAAFFVSMAIGLIFGIYPARKAAQLSPVEAMRKE
ncbi:ABC transporter permease [Patescibacteria group bacterium]|nr:ABC transporter permease [Patescibacteria group bacterium]